MFRAIQKDHLALFVATLSADAMGALFSHFSSQASRTKKAPYGLPAQADPLLFSQDLREMREIEIKITAFSPLKHPLSAQPSKHGPADAPYCHG
jgi:hypothetical protein